MGPASVDGYVEASGRAGVASVRFERLPFRLKDGQRRFCHGDFGSELIGQLHEVLPPAPTHFLLLGSARCRACGTGLTAAARPSSLDVQLRLCGVAPTTLTIEIPLTPCGNCGATHRDGDRQAESDLSDALIAAFEAAGLSH